MTESTKVKLQFAAILTIFVLADFIVESIASLF